MSAVTNVPTAAADRQLRTVGVAIAVPEPFGERLRAHRASFGDPRAALIPTHITLLPPTVVPERGSRVGQVEGGDDDPAADVDAHLHAVAAAASPFTIHLRGTATFRPVSKVVFVQLVRGISECELLERRVRSGPLARDLVFPYHPHVTVAHDLSDSRLDEAFETLGGFDASFDVREFHLYAHGSDGVWRPERTFAFGGARRVTGR